MKKKELLLNEEELQLLNYATGELIEKLFDETANLNLPFRKEALDLIGQLILLRIKLNEVYN